MSIKIKGIILKAVLVLTFSQFTVVTSNAQNVQFEQGSALELELVQIPDKPKIHNFRITPNSRESYTTLAWDRLNTITEYKLYRTISLLNAQSSPNNSFFSAFGNTTGGLTSFGARKLIKVLPSDRSSFSDHDIFPLNIENPSRSLGQRYCYTLEAWKNDKIYTESKRICTDRRGINPPSLVKGVETSTPYNSFKIIWEDDSSIEDGFYLNISIFQTAEFIRKIKVEGKNRESFLLKNLLPNTQYYVGVTAYDFYGESVRKGTRIRTSKSPEITPEPEIETFTLNLNRQEISQGMIPYFGRFPVFGSIPNGKLIKVKLLSQWPTLHFLKPGFNNSDCNQSNAVVVLNPSSELSSSQMETLFGSTKPSLPIDFVACAEETTPPTLLNWIPIKLFYTKD